MTDNERKDVASIAKVHDPCDLGVIYMSSIQPMDIIILQYTLLSYNTQHIYIELEHT
jgi:hypothetical protein